MIPILARELREAVRARWFLAVSGVFCVLALGVSWLSFSGAASLGFAGFSRTVASLLNLLLLFVPLMGLLVGSLGLSGEKEDGTLGYLLSQPVSRRTVFTAKLAGQAAALLSSIALGLGLAGLVVARRAGAHGAAAYGMLALDSALLAVASLSLGTLIAVVSPTRMRALSAALVAWVGFAFLLDAATVGLAVAGSVGPQGVFWLTFANPVQLAKTLCLLTLSARLDILGPSGTYALRTFGPTGAAAVLAGALVAWAALPASAAWIVFRRMNLK